jgi:hypothetical protein
VQRHLKSKAEPHSKLVPLEGIGHALPYRAMEREAWPWMSKF